MPFQTHVTTGQPQAVAGDKATLNPAVYAIGTLAAEEEITAGTFVFAGSQPGLARQSGTGQIKTGQANTGQTNTGQANTGALLGFVERTLAAFNYDLTSPGSLILAAGTPLTVARRGDYYATTSTAATPGQRVFASLTDGSISTAEANTAVEGALETDFSVIEGGPAGSLIIISNWS